MRRLAEPGLVLPRLLRRPARALLRVDLDRFEPPRLAATMATALLLGLTGIYGVLQGGHTEAVVQTITSRAGFAIEDLRVTGNSHTSEIDVLQQIGLDGWTSMIGFDVREARDRIVELPWVESATVRKIYPATIEVDIVERRPFAIWQQGSQLSVIEENGEIIGPLTGGALATLPLVIGIGADKTGAAFIDEVSRIRGLQGRVRAYIRVADRRWDLRLDNGMTIKLPERGVDEALSEASRLDAHYALFSRDVETLDLRLPDRMTVALGASAMEQREIEVKELMKRKKGARI